MTAAASSAGSTGPGDPAGLTGHTAPTCPAGSTGPAIGLSPSTLHLMYKHRILSLDISHMDFCIELQLSTLKYFFLLIHSNVYYCICK